MQIGVPVYPEVVVIGAASMDIKGKTVSGFVLGSSCPGDVRISLGGSARNMAENLGRFGVRTLLLTAVGADNFGYLIRDRTAAAGVDVSRAIISTAYPSATYVAMIDAAGIPYLGVDDMAIVSAITPDYVYSQRDLIRRTKMVAVDANLAPRTLTMVFNLARRYDVPVCVNPVSVALAPRLKSCLQDCYMITPNAKEAAVLSDVAIIDLPSGVRAAQSLLSAGTKLAIVTLGEEGVVYASSNGNGHVPAVRCEVIDRTGAGDSLAAAVVYGLINGFSVDEALHLGVSAATMALSSRDTVNPEISLESLYQKQAV